eukprot:3095841-Rhodomonas_salina.1
MHMGAADALLNFQSVDFARLCATSCNSATSGLVVLLFSAPATSRAVLSGGYGATRRCYWTWGPIKTVRYCLRYPPTLPPTRSPPRSYATSYAHSSTPLRFLL